MAKFWIQYDAASGTYVPWEANTPPSPESVHRARFLSQFAAWIKYLSAMEGTDPALWFPCGNGSCATDHSFIYPASGTGDYRHIGTIIQTASFWNMLNWKPNSSWLNVAERDLVEGTVLHDIKTPLVETDAYAETETGDIQKGECIHPCASESQILSWLWKLRLRIDLCCAVEATLVASGGLRNYWYVNWDGDIYEGYRDTAPGDYDMADITTGARVRWENLPSWQAWRWVSARNVVLTANGMPEETHYSATLYETDAFPSGHPSIPFEETSESGSMRVEAVSMAPNEGANVIISSKYENITGANFGSGDGIISVYLRRIGIAITMETPPEMYLPSNALFNDSCPFQKLYNA